MDIKSARFGVTPNGEEIEIFTLANGHGMEVGIINYGGIITSISVPDRSGGLSDVVLGHETLDGYLNHSRYFGAVVGRYANRIARGRFKLNTVEYQLAINNGKNHLHGGFKGFDKVVWKATQVDGGVQLNYLSEDGEENYPGRLEATVTYRLTDANELRIDYRATSDHETIINLTNHSYFNLNGGGTILNHELQIEADAFTPVDETLIPTGEIRNVRDTPMDFTSPTAIGRRICDDYEQLRNAGGYDHNFILRGQVAALRTAARVYERASGRVMEVRTTQPGMQFYSGNFLDGSIIGKGGRAYDKHSACCFETQHFPDSPNQPNFPSTVLKPGEEYSQATIYKFSVE